MKITNIQMPAQEKSKEAEIERWIELNCKLSNSEEITIYQLLLPQQKRGLFKKTSPRVSTGNLAGFLATLTDKGYLLIADVNLGWDNENNKDKNSFNTTRALLFSCYDDTKSSQNKTGILQSIEEFSQLEQAMLAAKKKGIILIPYDIGSLLSLNFDIHQWLLAIVKQHELLITQYVGKNPTQSISQTAPQKPVMHSDRILPTTPQRDSTSSRLMYPDLSQINVYPETTRGDATSDHSELYPALPTPITTPSCKPSAPPFTTTTITPSCKSSVEPSAPPITTTTTTTSTTFRKLGVEPSAPPFTTTTTTTSTTQQEIKPTEIVYSNLSFTGSKDSFRIIILTITNNLLSSGFYKPSNINNGNNPIDCYLQQISGEYLLLAEEGSGVINNNNFYPKTFSTIRKLLFKEQKNSSVDQLKNAAERRGYKGVILIPRCIAQTLQPKTKDQILGDELIITSCATPAIATPAMPSMGPSNVTKTKAELYSQYLNP
jgi:hypothetical protein